MSGSAATIHLAPYEILDLLGEGALSSVYRVRSIKDGSVRALKALKADRAGDERTVARFEDEYRILSALHHPTLPEVYDYGRYTDGTPFIVMDFIEGVPLGEHLRDVPDDLWVLLFQLNEALAFVHEHNLLHLDLKPSNVLVRQTKLFGGVETPLPVLIDFGLSYRRDVGGKAKLVGTPGYMAPEIIRGEENLTRAADYYSLGVILYETVEGRLPFRGSMEDILRGHLVESAAFESQKVEYAELYPWIEKLMSKEPRARLEAFGDFRRAVAARLGEATAGIERVFALGYIDSLGLIGKEEAWKELKTWLGNLADRLSFRLKTASLRKPGVTKTGPRDVLKGSVTDLEKRIEEDLLSSAAPARRPEEEPVSDVPRVLAVSGPPESGKSHVIGALRSELLVRGVHVISLGNESDYAALVRGVGRRRGKHERSADVDPASLVIDRFVAAWDALAAMGKQAGVVVIVDDLLRASGEEKEFVEYIAKRAGHELAERNEPGVFVVAVGSALDVKTALGPVAAREGAMAAVEVPPPGRQAADAIAAGFRGRLSGVKEEKSLAAYLQANLHTGAALYASLKQSIADGTLTHQYGKWHFREQMAAPAKSAVSSAAYYEGVFRGLTEGPRTVVAFLACHPGALSLDELTTLCGLPFVQIEGAIESLGPLRIIDIADTPQGRRVEIISDHVREGLLLGIGKSERDAIHARFVECFGERLGGGVGHYEVMAHHFEELGRVKDALVMRIRAVAAARTSRDVFAVRRVCEVGVAYSRGLRSGEWKARNGLVERYFVKQWVNAEWTVANYGNIVRVIEENYTRCRREVPLSFLYKYATALERVGQVEACKKVLAEGKERVQDKESETYYLLLLAEGCLLNEAGMFKESLTLLGTIRPQILAPPARAKLYVRFMFNFIQLGQEDRCHEFIEKAEELPREAELVDHLLRIEYTRIRLMLVKGRYSATKQMIRKGIRTAVRHKAYRSMCSMYMIASGLYYELGDYPRTMKFLDRTIEIAKEKNTPNSVYEYTVRYSYIYRKIGQYGNAIERAEGVVRAVGGDPAHYQVYFEALTALFTTLILINSRRTKDISVELRRAAEHVQAQHQLAFYHQSMGKHYERRAQVSDALKELEKARDAFSTLRMQDDRVGVTLAMASLLVREKRLEEARELIDEARRAMVATELADLRAKYLTVELEYRVTTGAENERIVQCMNRCEAIRLAVRDFDVAHKLDAGLFHGAVGVGDSSRAMDIFDRYYEDVRHAVGSLSPVYVAEYVRDPELLRMIEKYRSLKA